MCKKKQRLEPSRSAVGVGAWVGVAAALGVTLALGLAVPWASKLAAIVNSVSEARKDLGT